jgi:hypothetical protein
LASVSSPYRSPVRLVRYASESVNPFSQQAISRTKKKLLAEIALNNDEITLDGLLYTRNDVSAVLDDVTESNWVNHCIIYSHPGLLNFLETNSFDDAAMTAAAQFIYKPSFVEFVSPWFSYAFNEASGKLLRLDDDYAEMGKLIRYPSFILSDYSEDAYQKIRNYLDELLYTLRNLNWEKFSKDESVLHFIFSSHWISFINGLPSSFNSYRDRVVECMINLVWQFQKRATWHYLEEVCLKLARIDCSPTWKEEVRKYAQIMHKNALIESRTGSSGEKGERTSWSRGVFWGIWVLFTIFRIARCSDTTQTPAYDMNNFSFQPASSVYEDLNTSHNEKNFKTFLAGFNLGQHSGKKALAKNGSTPFEKFGMPLPDAGANTVTFKNETAYDALLFYFENNNHLVDSNSGVYAVYVKKGESFTTRVNPGAGNFNLVFGKNWTNLNEPGEFKLEKVSDNTNAARLTLESSGTWHLKQYFQTLASSQQYLNHDISILTYAKSSGDKLLYQPIADTLGKVVEANAEKKLQLNLVDKNGAITIEAKGNLYLYLSPEQFPLPSEQISGEGPLAFK